MCIKPDEKVFFHRILNSHWQIILCGPSALSTNNARNYVECRNSVVLPSTKTIRISSSWSLRTFIGQHEQYLFQLGRLYTLTGQDTQFVVYLPNIVYAFPLWSPVIFMCILCSTHINTTLSKNTHIHTQSQHLYKRNRKGEVQTKQEQKRHRKLLLKSEQAI